MSEREREPRQNVETQKNHRYPKRGARWRKKKNTNNLEGEDFGHHQGLQQHQERRHHAGYATLQYDMSHGMQYPYGQHAYGHPPLEGHHANPTSIVFTSQQFVPYYHAHGGLGGWTETSGHGHAGMHPLTHTHPLARTNSGPGNPAAHNGDPKEKQPVAPPSTLGNLWTSSALPAIEDNSADSPDLERFLRASTPRFKMSADPNSLRDFKLMDVWKHFERISAYGLRCATYGGPRGPSSSYFVPFLSSIQMFEPVTARGNDADNNCPSDGLISDEEDILEYPEGLEAWPRHMRRVYSWGAKNHVGERLPLYQQVTELCGAEGLNHALSSSKVSQLHPYSWFAVAWYPLYRVPEAPLTARFLTFHSLAPLWEAAMQSVADRRSISALHTDAMDAMARIHIDASHQSHPAGFSGVAPKGRAPSHKSSHSSGNISVGSTVLSIKTDRTEKTEKGVLGTFPESIASERSNSDGSSQKLGTAMSGHGSEVETEKEEECLEKSASCAATTISSTASLSKIELPPVGLCWHTSNGNASSRSRRLPSENWTDTMVKLSADMDQAGLSSGDSLPGSTNACVVNVSTGYVVVKKDYPLCKGGPLSWEIQMEELAEGAKRLALGKGIVSVNSAKSSNAADPAVVDASETCPDYAFFLSRASSMTTHNNGR
jgi:hypothetical protein